MIIRNALVYGEDKTFSRLDIRIEEDVFTEICPSLAPSEMNLFWMQTDCMPFRD